MRLTTRLLLAILPIVVLVMGALAGWFLFERQRVLVPQMQQQTRAYARALDIAFELGLRSLDSSQITAVLERTTAESRVAEIRVYDAAGRVKYSSSSVLALPLVSPDTLTTPLLPRAMLARVLAGEPELATEQMVDGEPMFSVLRTLRAPSANDRSGVIIGALEVTQPYALLLAEVRRLELDVALATGLLLLTVTGAIAYMSRRTIARPLEQLVAAARALGEGDIDARVPHALGAAEPNALAREFNEMATRLSTARRELLQQSEERVALERRLAEAEKLATVGTLAAGLAHELGAPLNVISGRAEMLLGQEETAPHQMRHLQSIVAQSGRITRTVRSLLDYARRPARRDEEVELESVVAAAMELLEPEFARAGTTVDRVTVVDARVRGDADQLQQVLTNLLLNAMQAMDGQPRPHHITITTDWARTDAGLPPAEVETMVDDTGPGLSSDLDGRLFTPFATTKATGTGLGLVVARSIAQDHGGTLDGTNRTDGMRGARFTFRLPIASVDSTGDRR